MYRKERKHFINIGLWPQNTIRRMKEWHRGMRWLFLRIAIIGEYFIIFEKLKIELLVN